MPDEQEPLSHAGDDAALATLPTDVEALLLTALAQAHEPSESS